VPGLSHRLDVFGEEVELFDHLIALRDAALPGDGAGLRAQLEGLDGDLERIAIAQAALSATAPVFDLSLVDLMGQ